MTIHAPAQPVPLMPVRQPQPFAAEQLPDAGLLTSTVSGAAALSFTRAVHAFAAHRPETGPALAEALVADPNHVAAQAVLGFAKLTLARSELMAPAAEALTGARAALVRAGGGTGDERALVSALGIAAGGEFVAAADALDRAFAQHPGALLPFKLSQSLRFMAGDLAGMLMRSRAALTDLPADRGAGFILGCHAFALEEHGQYDAAEAAGRQAVRVTPEDSWGRHAVSHVQEMRGQTAEGIFWLETGRAHWTRCNNFAFHMAWHLALLHLNRGDHDRVLELYDTEVRPTQTDDYRDMANAVSLLWRLQRTGVDVGTRWDDLAHIARARAGDTTLIFAALHTMTALVALKDEAGIAEMLAALEARAAETDEQASVAARVGLPLARLLAGRTAETERPALDRLAMDLPALGGSNAQRDLFLLELTEIAGRAGDTATLARLRSLRGQLKAEDRLIRIIGSHTAH